VSLRLVIVSPCKDEELYIPHTLRSMAAQTRPPDLWLVVDDGSSDGTPRLVSEYAARHPWIELVRLDETRGGRDSGKRVTDAFRHGFGLLDDDPYDVVAKLDCDLEFGPTFVETIMANFDDPSVGLAGGTMRVESGFDACSGSHIPGPTKFYRRACFEQIGGMRRVRSWDILDGVDARRHGWRTVSDPGAPFAHLRPEGSSVNIVRSRFDRGLASYEIGSHPLFAMGRAAFRAGEWPPLVGSLAYLCGFAAGYLLPGAPRIEDRELISALRREQLHRIFHGNRLPAGGLRGGGGK
jgi:poly-beta-1,6-N-acetyl-D-glucosamine synthase